MSTLKVSNIQDISNNAAMSISNGVVTATNAVRAPGAMLQMPFTQYTGTTQVSITGGSNTSIDVLSVNITPKSTSSIIRLDTHIFHEWSNQHAAYNGVWFFYRDSTKLAHAEAGNRGSGISMSTISYIPENVSTPEIASYSYFDSPNTTNQITYKVGHLNYGSYTLNINRTGTDVDNTQHERGISFISATEIGG